MSNSQKQKYHRCTSQHPVDDLGMMQQEKLVANSLDLANARVVLFFSVLVMPRLRPSKKSIVEPLIIFITKYLAP